MLVVSLYKQILLFSAYQKHSDVSGYINTDFCVLKMGDLCSDIQSAQTAHQF